MPLNKDDLAFLTRRAKLIAWWPVAGIAALVVILGVFVSLFFFEPYLANPMVIFSRLDADLIPATSIFLMAAFVPILFCILFALIIVMLLFTAQSFFTEKRYMSLIDKAAGTTFIQGHGQNSTQIDKPSEVQ